MHGRVGERVVQKRTVCSVDSIKGLHEAFVHTFKARSVIMAVFFSRHRVSGKLTTMEQEGVKELSEEGEHYSRTMELKLGKEGRR